MEIEPIAYIKTDFKEKFGIPRQSSLASNTVGKITFKKEFRNPDALKGLEGFSHLWLIWEFSANSNKSDGWSPLVRPPRLGGNTYMGVFATRSPFRPNPLGLSCVELERVDWDAQDGPVILVKGADLMDGTPIDDIKPYIGYADSRPEAVCGYVDALEEKTLKVVIPENIKAVIADEKISNALSEVLSLDPRPSYHNDPDREYGMSFAGYNVKFRIVEECGVQNLYVTDISWKILG